MTTRSMRSSGSRKSSEADFWERGGASSDRPPARPGYPESVRCDDENVYLTLKDGRELSLPLTPRLRIATPAQRAHYELDDEGIRWPEADEDIGTHTFFGITESELYDFLGYQQWDPEGRPVPKGSLYREESYS